jgi:hypothetical protein
MSRALIEGLLKIGLQTASTMIPGGAALVAIGAAVANDVIERIQAHNNGRALDDLTQAEMEASVAALVWKSPEELEKEGLGGG